MLYLFSKKSASAFIAKAVAATTLLCACNVFALVDEGPFESVWA